MKKICTKICKRTPPPRRKPSINSQSTTPPPSFCPQIKQIKRIIGVSRCGRQEKEATCYAASFLIAYHFYSLVVKHSCASREARESSREARECLATTTRRLTSQSLLCEWRFHIGKGKHLAGVQNAEHRYHCRLYLSPSAICPSQCIF